MNRAYSIRLESACEGSGAHMATVAQRIRAFAKRGRRTGGPSLPAAYLRTEQPEAYGERAQVERRRGEVMDTMRSLSLIGF